MYIYEVGSAQLCCGRRPLFRRASTGGMFVFFLRVFFFHLFFPRSDVYFNCVGSYAALSFSSFLLITQPPPSIVLLLLGYFGYIRVEVDVQKTHTTLPAAAKAAARAKEIMTISRSVSFNLIFHLSG